MSPMQAPSVATLVFTPSPTEGRGARHRRRARPPSHCCQEAPAPSPPSLALASPTRAPSVAVLIFTPPPTEGRGTWHQAREESSALGEGSRVAPVSSHLPLLCLHASAYGREESSVPIEEARWVRERSSALGEDSPSSSRLPSSFSSPSPSPLPFFFFSLLHSSSSFLPLPLSSPPPSSFLPSPLLSSSSSPASSPTPSSFSSPSRSPLPFFFLPSSLLLLLPSFLSHNS